MGLLVSVMCEFSWCISHTNRVAGTLRAAERSRLGWTKKELPRIPRNRSRQGKVVFSPFLEGHQGPSLVYVYRFGGLIVSLGGEGNYDDDTNSKHFS